MPYVVLTMLLIRGVFLDGAKEGMLFFITPDVSRLNDPAVRFNRNVAKSTLIAHKKPNAVGYRCGLTVVTGVG